MKARTFLMILGSIYGAGFLGFFGYVLFEIIKRPEISVIGLAITYSIVFLGAAILFFLLALKATSKDERMW